MNCGVYSSMMKACNFEPVNSGAKEKLCLGCRSTMSWPTCRPQLTVGSNKRMKYLMNESDKLQQVGIQSHQQSSQRSITAKEFADMIDVVADQNPVAEFPDL